MIRFFLLKFIFTMQQGIVLKEVTSPLFSLATYKIRNTKGVIIIQEATRTGKGWRRLTRITNDELENFGLNYS